MPKAEKLRSNKETIKSNAAGIKKTIQPSATVENVPDSESSGTEPNIQDEDVTKNATFTTSVGNDAMEGVEQGNGNSYVNVGSHGNIPEETRIKEVERILNCKTNDWYSILDVERDCKPLVARRACIKSLLLIKDRFETGSEDIKSKANQATKLIRQAAEELKAGNTYVEVDESGRRAGPSQSEPYTPTPKVKEIYEQATGSVLILFSGIEDTSRAELEILQYNEDIRDLVLRTTPNATVLQQIIAFIELETILGYIKLRKEHKLKKSSTRTSDKANTAHSEEKLGQMGFVIQEFNSRKGYPTNWNWDIKSNPEVWVAKSSGDAEQDTNFSPGQTKDGEEILGYLPRFRKDRSDADIVDTCEFVITDADEKNLGNMRIATWIEIGLEEGQAYLDQPEEEKLAIAHSPTRYQKPTQKNQYRELVGFWADFSANKKRWGRAYCWINLKDDSYDIITKGCFESIVGSAPAAKLIKDLFDNDESNFIWRNMSEAKASKSKSIREGPYGPVAVQKRKMIDNGPQSDESMVPSLVATSAHSDKLMDPSLAAILARLQAETEANRVRMEAQATDIQAKLEMLFKKLENVKL